MRTRCPPEPRLCCRYAATPSAGSRNTRQRNGRTCFLSERPRHRRRPTSRNVGKYPAILPPIANLFPRFVNGLKGQKDRSICCSKSAQVTSDCAQTAAAVTLFHPINSCWLTLAHRSHSGRTHTASRSRDRLAGGVRRRVIPAVVHRVPLQVATEETIIASETSADRLGVGTVHARAVVT
jgi:hypothetical protein